MSFVDDRRELAGIFKVKSPLRDLTFYAAILPIVAVLNPDAAAWVSENREAFVPLIVWLAAHGYVRGKAVTAAAR